MQVGRKDALRYLSPSPTLPQLLPLTNGIAL